MGFFRESKEGGGAGYDKFGSSFVEGRTLVCSFAYSELCSKDKVGFYYVYDAAKFVSSFAIVLTFSAGSYILSWFVYSY